MALFVPKGEERQLTEVDIYATAVGLLARREHSLKELTTKLRSRGAEVALIESVLERLIGERLQSDERYTEAYLRMRSEKGYGPQRIVVELRERGISDALISAQFRQAESSGELDWFERAATAYRKKFGIRPIEDIKERAKRMRFLQYRGFGHEHIAAALEDE